MAPMGTARDDFASVLKDMYIYVFGGCNDDEDDMLSSTERYSINNNAWEYLAGMPKGPRYSQCAVTTKGSEIYIVGGYHTCSADIFDTGPSLSWRTPTHLRHMPEERRRAAAVVVKKKYLVVIGGHDEEGKVAASCLIYDVWFNHWSSTPAFMDMIEERHYHTASALDGKIVVAGGSDDDGNELASVECIDADALLEYAPLHYPLPRLLFDRILEIGKFERDCISCTV